MAAPTVAGLGVAANPCGQAVRVARLVAASRARPKRSGSAAAPRDVRAITQQLEVAPQTAGAGASAAVRRPAAAPVGLLDPCGIALVVPAEVVVDSGELARRPAAARPAAQVYVAQRVGPTAPRRLGTVTAAPSPTRASEATAKAARPVVSIETPADADTAVPVATVGDGAVAQLSASVVDAVPAGGPVGEARSEAAPGFPADRRAKAVPACAAEAVPRAGAAVRQVLGASVTPSGTARRTAAALLAVGPPPRTPLVYAAGVEARSLPDAEAAARVLPVVTAVAGNGRHARAGDALVRRAPAPGAEGRVAPARRAPWPSRPRPRRRLAEAIAAGAAAAARLRRVRYADGDARPAVQELQDALHRPRFLAAAPSTVGRAGPPAVFRPRPAPGPGRTVAARPFLHCLV